MMNVNDNDSDSDGEIEAFTNLDLTGVNFDEVDVDVDVAGPPQVGELTPMDKMAVDLEHKLLVGDSFQHLESSTTSTSNEEGLPSRLFQIANCLAEGRYIDALQGDTASWFLLDNDTDTTTTASIWERIRSKISNKIQTISESVELEFLAIAALNLFLQLNYTGPLLDDDSVLQPINPHVCFAEQLHAVSASDQEKSASLTAKRDTSYHNSVLSELAVDGVWPCQVSNGPYLLLLARCILSCLSNPMATKGWMMQETNIILPESVCQRMSQLQAVHLWSARSAVAHERLLLVDEPTLTLWQEVDSTFTKCLEASFFASPNSQDANNNAKLKATVLLEYGLAEHHFDRPKKGKPKFEQAIQVSGLTVEVTGAEGKRTKYQKKATAQMVVRATSARPEVIHDEVKSSDNDNMANAQLVKSQEIELEEDTILLDRVQFEETKDNQVTELTVLDQSILLALCLDVKNSNPADGLTGEEMGAYLSRVLCHSDDWMVYSTGLLERAWLEFERNHTKERSILQMQALADQHTNQLTITQSTRASIEESSPVQDRLLNLHSIVYPPRWHMLRDVAERYAALGIVTSAAELFAEIEYWDGVVACYRRAGKNNKAEEIVRERLAISETPRMWAVLGDITNDPTHYEKAIELSNGRFSTAYINLGQYYFDRDDLEKSAVNYRKSLKLRSHAPAVWFRLGTISMRLEDWDSALVAFTEVVQQQPDEHEAWANVAAVHMHNRNAALAYPALVEVRSFATNTFYVCVAKQNSPTRYPTNTYIICTHTTIVSSSSSSSSSQSLKQNRNNWRVWVSKLYTCLDLGKFDEAVQACLVILDFRKSQSVNGVPELEEKCVRAIVGGVISNFMTNKQNATQVGALEASRRSLARVLELLERLSANSKESWIFETIAYFHSQVGQDEQVLENLMKEYRSLQSVRGWEKDDAQVVKVCQAVTQIVRLQADSKENVAKSKFLVSGVVKRVKQSRIDMTNVPEEIVRLEQLLEELGSKSEGELTES
jgi:tetratricopeptide (TPR) repeat protein